MLGWGLNVVVGLAGLLDSRLCRVYAVRRPILCACSPPTLELSFCGVLPLAGILDGVLGRADSDFPCCGLRGDYLAIVTLAFGEIIASSS